MLCHIRNVVFGGLWDHLAVVSVYPFHTPESRHSGSWSDACIITYKHVCDLWHDAWKPKLLSLFPTVAVEVTLRPTVSRPVRLGVRHPSGARDEFFFLLQIFFRQLRVRYFVAPSLTRRWVCNLLYNCFWALPEQSLLGRSAAELTAIFYCLIWDSPNLEGQISVFMCPRNRVLCYSWQRGIKCWDTLSVLPSICSTGPARHIGWSKCCPANCTPRQYLVLT
jgi:hypothetical protein